MQPTQSCPRLSLPFTSFYSFQQKLAEGRHGQIVLSTLGGFACQIETWNLGRAWMQHACWKWMRVYHISCIFMERWVLRVTIPCKVRLFMCLPSLTDYILHNRSMISFYVNQSFNWRSSSASQSNDIPLPGGVFRWSEGNRFAYEDHYH